MSLQPQLFASAQGAVVAAGGALKRLGHEVRSERWQSVEPPAPMWEMLEVSFRHPIARSVSLLASDVKPNLPWADLHFAERVGRVPSNPGTAWSQWPYFKVNKGREREALRHDEQFTHTYQERIWASGYSGIRYEYGDLDDVVALLKEQPNTRQAFLPIWFPEDTGVMHRGRVPCTLGYLFRQHEEYLHCTYYIRSCDYFRHLRDDVYLASRLALWVAAEVGLDWSPGMLNMHVGSLHCWVTERALLPR